MAEFILIATELTPEHRQHGWNPRIIEVLANMCAEFREQVEAGTFANPRAGYALGRTKMEEVSPKWPDLDELSVALGRAERMLDILAQAKPRSQFGLEATPIGASLTCPNAAPGGAYLPALDWHLCHCAPTPRS